MGKSTRQAQNKNEKSDSYLSTRPYKGARDFYPENIRIRNYIFNTWKTVCKCYGFEEYDFPFLEDFDIYAAKTGEEIVNKQLYWFTDKGGRKIAIRPEKTPSLARMVAARIKQIPKPIRWFNIGNCWRFEKPQKGRGREFFQFDCDILGSHDITADVEVFSIPLQIMQKLGATREMFEIKVSNRRLTEFYLKEIVKVAGSIGKQTTQMYKIAKIIDRKPKITEKEFLEKLQDENLNPHQIEKVQQFLNCDLNFIEQYKEKSYGASEIIQFFEIAEDLGYKDFFKFSPEIMRGLDYYTGNVIEQFDLSPENNRSMYGGGRYDNLVSLFTSQKLTGVGFAMGDMTLLEFLKRWDLLPLFTTETKVLVTIFDKNTQKKSLQVAQQLRKADIHTISALEIKKLDKQLKYADLKEIPFVIIIGPDEIQKGTVQLKNMVQKTQKEMTLDQVIKKLKSTTK